MHLTRQTPETTKRRTPMRHTLLFLAISILLLPLVGVLLALLAQLTMLCSVDTVPQPVPTAYRAAL